jgi:predicted transcriptional regulator
MVHCPGISATYRQGHGDSGLGNTAHANHWQAWHAKLTTQFVDQTTPAELAQTLTWHAIELDRVQTSLDISEQIHRHQLAQQQQENQQLTQSLAQQLEEQQQENQQLTQSLAQQLEEQQQTSQQLAQSLTQQLEEQQQTSQQLSQTVEKLTHQSLELVQIASDLESQLSAIRHTRFWRHLSPLWRLEGWLRSKLQ